MKKICLPFLILLTSFTVFGGPHDSELQLTDLCIQLEGLLPKSSRELMPIEYFKSEHEIDANNCFLPESEITRGATPMALERETYLRLLKIQDGERQLQALLEQIIDNVRKQRGFLAAEQFRFRNHLADQTRGCSPFQVLVGESLNFTQMLCESKLKKLPSSY